MCGAFPLWFMEGDASQCWRVCLMLPGLELPLDKGGEGMGSKPIVCKKKKKDGSQFPDFVISGFL